ncbi:major facilitator superfamily metabolite/H+ symporter [Enterobacter cancerogenus]|uniref:Major facilitator superfamily metabolite/H+ symporter n=1 Tax=Enterobacter cancerogenus TaxID=69218 RepID=A0A484XM56_9ENTR|nr:major facilitator superfamily metabolite/H+ symporter [Enterobacter cancerogenus]
MDSTLISDRPDEETPSLNRARRAALGSFAGAVVDWYDFLLYGITAALVFNREFFPQISPAMGTLAAFATFGVGFLFRPLGGVIFGHFGDRLGRKRMLMLTVVDDGHCHGADWDFAVVCHHRLVGARPAGDASRGAGLCRRRRMGRRGAALR